MEEDGHQCQRAGMWSSRVKLCRASLTAETCRDVGLPSILSFEHAWQSL
jgi:hypothetical protein